MLIVLHSWHKQSTKAYSSHLSDLWEILMLTLNRCLSYVNFSRSSHYIVKSELRYPIIQAIRSQWESQDLPALGNQYHVTDDAASQEQGYNTCALN